MKNKFLKIISLFAIIAIITIVINACKRDFLDQTTVGILTEAEAQSLKGAQQFLTASYAGVKGIGWEGGASNWVWGSIRGGDANKGSDAGDQADIVPIQQLSPSPTNNYFNVKWRAVYEGIARTNGTIRITNKLTATDISDAEKTQILAEARFLRGFFHFEAKRMWNRVPYVDETIDVTTANVPNDTDIWPKIMADFDFVRTNLTATPAKKEISANTG